MPTETGARTPLQKNAKVISCNTFPPTRAAIIATATNHPAPKNVSSTARDAYYGRTMHAQPPFPQDLGRLPHAGTQDAMQAVLLVSLITHGGSGCTPYFFSKTQAGIIVCKYSMLLAVISATSRIPGELLCYQRDQQEPPHHQQQPSSASIQAKPLSSSPPQTMCYSIQPTAQSSTS